MVVRHPSGKTCCMGLDRTPDDRNWDRVLRGPWAFWILCRSSRKAMTHRSGKPGPGLSGGQRQRFSVARALCAEVGYPAAGRGDRRHDISGKVCVWKSIRTLMAGKTVVYVAHDAQTLQNADWILVLEHGTVTSGGRSPDGFAAKRVLP